jgi:hypothetical protein
MPCMSMSSPVRLVWWRNEPTPSRTPHPLHQQELVEFAQPGGVDALARMALERAHAPGSKGHAPAQRLEPIGWRLGNHQRVWPASFRDS